MIGVQWRLHLLIQISLAVFFLFSQYWIIKQFDDQGLQDIQSRATETADGLINGLNLLMVTGKIANPQTRELLVQKMASSPGIKSLQVIRAPQVISQFGPGTQSEQTQDPRVLQVMSNALPYFANEVAADGSHELHAIIPFMASENFRGTNCLSCHHVASGSVNGVANIRMDLTAHDQQLAKLKQTLWASMLLFQLAVSGLISLLVSTVLKRHISTPVHKLQSIIMDIHESGDLSKRVKIEQEHPDIDTIAHSFNALMGNLQQATEGMRLLSKVVECSEEAILITDAQMNIVFVNQSFEKTTGFQAREVLGKNPRILKSGQQDQQFYKNMWSEINTHGSWQGEIFNKRRSGQIYPEWQSISSVKNARGDITNYVSIFLDITKRKEAEAHISKMANYDALTGLANRNLLNDRLTQALASAHRKHGKLAVMYLDLDNFKNINDGYGHSVGDELLKTAAARLLSCVREGDTVARQGGDEFILLLPEIESSSGAAKVAEKLLQTVAAPYVINGQEMFVSVSIGIGIYPDDGDVIEKLLMNADSAMYSAKQDGRNCYRMYTQEMNEQALRRLILQNNMRQALASNEFTLYYQPQLNKNLGKITGVEALLRWTDANEGVVSPAEFIPIAEESGLIVPIGAWVLQNACMQAKRWHTQGYPVTISVNVSARQFKEKDFDAVVENALQVSGLAPQYLELEMTEGILIEQDEAVSRMMTKLKEIGVKLALDDFGTGYSSLSYIKRFPIDRIKIDQSFVRDVLNDTEDAAIVDAIIYIAHGLKLEVIAEGVETLEQLEFLSSHHCNDVQGYLVSRPVPSDEVVAVLNAFGQMGRVNHLVDAAPTIQDEIPAGPEGEGIAVQVTQAADSATITLAGRFSLYDRWRFESAYKNLDAAIKRIVIDLAHVEYIDSSALGMLLVLRKHAQAEHIQLYLENPTEVVSKVFEVACFTKLFNISMTTA